MSSQKRPIGLYVHIPFCHVKCRFCDFAAYPGLLAEIPRYLKALDREMDAHRGQALDTLFIGGGTPSLLSPDEFRQLTASLKNDFTLTPNLEASIECNPETGAEEKFAAYLEEGVNRISFGLQATQDKFLKSLGRTHDYETFAKAFRAARTAGFKNVNIDLMYGLPGQTLEDWKECLARALAFGPEHLSAYALSIEDRTAFGKSGVDKDDDLQAEMYEVLYRTLEEAGFEHYEISNFAKPGFECRHNLKYWRNQDCAGIGVSSAGYLNGVRSKNHERVMDYLSAIESGGRPVIEEDRLAEGERIGEDLMLAFRLKEGCEVSEAGWNLYGAVIQKYMNEGFLRRDGARVVPTKKGWILSNQMFQDFLTPPEAAKVA